MSDLKLTVGDTAPTLTGTVNADLTGATIAIHILRAADDSVINRTGTIVTPATGAWSLPLVTGDLSVPGVYYLEVQATFAGGAIQTFREDANGRRTQFKVANQIA